MNILLKQPESDVTLVYICDGLKNFPRQPYWCSSGKKIFKFMQKIILYLLLCSLSLNLRAQKTIGDLVQAEKNFAAYARSAGTKPAFLQYLDSAGWVFEKGKAVNGISTWNKREKNAAVLNWWPLYAGISSSGDIGFTTGPWTYQRSGGDSVIARGHYATVWRLDKKGEWKVLVDMGVSDTPSIADTSVRIMNALHGTIDPNAQESFLQAEKDFIKNTESVQKNGRLRSIWYERNMSTKEPAVLNRNGRALSFAMDSAIATVNSMPSAIQYTIEGSGISLAGDLGYVFGTTVINNVTGNYLRVWKKEGPSWKLALEVLPY